MAKNVKNLIIFARDCKLWTTLIIALSLLFADILAQSVSFLLNSSFADQKLPDSYGN
jgi:hypothetical protein